MERLAKRAKVESFVEVFSGPNAPLSQHVAEVFNVEMPGSKLNAEKGITAELTRSEELGQPSCPELLGMGVESNAYRLAAVEAGRQPSYGKRNPLIPDGLLSPERHMEVAKKLHHPFQGAPV